MRPALIPHKPPICELRASAHALYCVMTNQNKSIARALLLLSAVAGNVLSIAFAAEPTAFELITEGNRYVGEQAKDKVVQLRSEKSVGGLTPKVWYVVFYDPTAALKAAEVKFSGGKMVDVSRPLRLLEPISGADQPLDRGKLKVDSNQALQTALKESVLKNIKLTASQLKLDRVGEGVLGIGGRGEIVWKVKLWANKIGDSIRDKEIGEVWVNVTDGKVTKNDLHVDRLN